jgi:hypothetical protein
VDIVGLQGVMLCRANGRKGPNKNTELVSSPFGVLAQPVFEPTPLALNVRSQAVNVCTAMCDTKIQHFVHTAHLCIFVFPPTALTL